VIFRLLSKLGYGRPNSKANASITLEGSKKEKSQQAGNRIVIVMVTIGLFYMALVGKLVWLGLQEEAGLFSRMLIDRSTSAIRPKLLDRNGQILAMDIKMASLFAEPRRIVDADEAIELLSTVLPDLNYKKIHKKLSSNAGFVWIKREMTPKQQNQIFALGIPGIGFRNENRRFYPGGPVASHILGLVNIDNQGIAGIEKYLDDNGLADLHDAGFAIKKDLKPVKMSVDLRVQHAVRDELVKAMTKYRAIAAAAVVMDVHTGEIRGMVSLPDYNPNNPVDAAKPDRLNRMSAGLFEMGSTFKTFTTAMALDSGLVSIKDKFDARNPIRIARHTITDFHGKRRILSVPEIFIYSSNIGTAKMADRVGIKGHKEFLTRMGLLTRMKGLELPEIAKPTQPNKWKKINSITISFGHGISTTPLQTAMAAAALMNGGKLVPPTLFPRSRKEADEISTRVVSEKTSDLMRYLFRLNALKGSGRKAEVQGYLVGGKTGTAEKVVNGRYSRTKRFNAFLSAFPMDDPQYVVLVVIDEPKPEKGNRYATAGWNAAPTVKAIISRTGPLLGVHPDFREQDTAIMSSY
jgi:cell division protein FtsI (penicillin-binding protein 3)